MAALSGDANKLCLHQTAEMSAGSRGRHLCEYGQFGAGARASIEQAEKDAASRWLANSLSKTGKQDVFVGSDLNHGSAG